MVATTNAVDASSTGIQVLSTGVWSGVTITAGTGTSITNGNGVSGNPTINAVGGGLTWNVITAASQAMVSNNGYIANNAGQLAFTLPTSSSVGDMISLFGINNATGWKITYTTNQQIFFGTSTTTLTTGSLASTHTRDAVTMICTTANLTWTVISSIGSLTVV